MNRVHALLAAWGPCAWVLAPFVVAALSALIRWGAAYVC